MKALITGITGSLGKSVMNSLLEQGVLVVGYSRDENKQAFLEKHKNLTLYLGDVRDQWRLYEATRGVDIIFHFAALKHVDKLEENPEEAIETNILGTKNVLFCQRMHKIPRVVLSSTDKAAYPVNSYGMSKGLAERLVQRNPNNIVCRYGNVLASRGSVVERFVKSLKEKQIVEMTDPNMSRFWITIEEASQFVVNNGLNGSGGLKIPSMRSAPLYLIAETIADIMKIRSYEAIQIGLRPGEKMVECLRTEQEGEECFSNRVPEYTQQDLIKVLTPIIKEMTA